MSIVLKHVNKSYGEQRVVRDTSLHIETGELFILLGASGSGKSTLLRLIAGLLMPDSGQIFLNDRDVTYFSPQDRRTGFVFQNYSLFQHMTVAQNIAFGLEVKRVPKVERARRVQELLELIELPELGNRLPKQLSGGQQQRVALARALAYTPDVLLLDEPFGALDVKIRGQLRQNLREIQQRLGVTTILVTHDQDEAFELADRIGVIDKGELLEVGHADQLYRQPQHRFTATFLGRVNLIQAQRNGTQVYVGENTLPAPANTEALSGQAVELALRPESVELARTPESLSGHLLGSAIVEACVFAAPLERVQLRLDSGGSTLEALIPPEVARQLQLRPGERVFVGAGDFHLLGVSVGTIGE